MANTDFSKVFDGTKPTKPTMTINKTPKQTYPLRLITINTCGPLYQKWTSKKRMYAKATDGINVKVEYADTLELCDPDQEPITIFGLHGAPGSHEDFRPFIEYFGAKKIRIIVPNYPDFNLTIQTKVFRHSAEEKYEFIMDFMEAINLKKIDLLLAHSSSVYPATLLMCEQQRIDIKSVAFFNPAGHRRIMAMRPAWFTEGSVKVYQNKLGRFIFKLFGKSFIKATNSVTVKPESMNNVILSAQTMRYSNFKELDKYLNKLKDTNKPTLWVFSENDRLVEKEIFYEMVDIMGATEKNTQQYDKSGSILSEYTDDSHIRVVVFKSGGHYAFLKYSSEVIQECDKFLNYVMQPADKRSINDPVTPISAPGC